MNSTQATTTRGPRAGARALTRANKAFTLVELIIVISIVALLATLVLPGMVQALTSGADARAYNLLAGQLTAARALAIESKTYTAVHVQLADPVATGLDHACFSAVMWIDPANAVSDKFSLAPGHLHRRTPGTIAFGEIDDDFINAGAYDNEALEDDPGARVALEDFAGFTIVFSPKGQVVTREVTFDASENTLFDPDNDDKRLWVDPGTEDSVLAFTMFDLGHILALQATTAAAIGDLRADYLNESGQFLPINTYTGRLFPKR